MRRPRTATAGAHLLSSDSAACTGHLAHQADVRQYALLPVVLLHQLGAPAGAHGALLMDVGAKINRLRRVLLAKLQDAELQVMNADKHRETRVRTGPRKKPAYGRKP